MLQLNFFSDPAWFESLYGHFLNIHSKSIACVAQDQCTNYIAFVNIQYGFILKALPVKGKCSLFLSKCKKYPATETTSRTKLHNTEHGIFLKKHIMT